MVEYGRHAGLRSQSERVQVRFLLAAQGELMDILVYTMGRVGSMATKKALENCGLKVANAHYLLGHGEFGGVGSHKFITALRKKVLPVVALVRDPIARNLSAFYLHRDKYAGFRKDYPQSWALDWIEDELNITMGTDIYSRNFNKLGGYDFYATPWGPVMIIRTEDLTRVSEDAFEQFIGVRALVEKPEPRRNNAYADFVASQRPFPKHYLDMMYETPYMRTFYTDTEIHLLREKWGE